MDAGLDDVLFWGSLSFALFVAGFFAFPVNRWLLQRGKGHTAVHETGIHGGPSPRVVGAIAAAAGAFGTVVLMAEAVGLGQALGLVLAQEALEQAPVALLVAQDRDDHVLCDRVAAFAELDDLVVVLDRAGLRLDHSLDHVDDVGLLVGGWR